MTSSSPRAVGRRRDLRDLLAQRDQSSRHQRDCTVGLAVSRVERMRLAEVELGGALRLADGDDLHGVKELAFGATTLFRSPENETSTDVKPS